MIQSGNKISGLTEKTTLDEDDEFLIVDNQEPAPTSKKATVKSLIELNASSVFAYTVIFGQ